MATTACTLPTVDRPLRLAEFDALFALVTSVDHEGHVARLHLSGPPTLHEQVIDLTERESQCCSFFTFAVDGTESEVDLRITAPAPRAAIVAALVARAQEIVR